MIEPGLHTNNSLKDSELSENEGYFFSEKITPGKYRLQVVNTFLQRMGMAQNIFTSLNGNSFCKSFTFESLNENVFLILTFKFLNL